TLGACIAAGGAVAAGLLWMAGAGFEAGEKSGEDEEDGRRSALIRHLWLAYGAGVAAGLMIIGHASGILKALDAGERLTVLAPVLVALGNMTGGIAAGWCTDRIGVRAVLTSLPAVSFAALILLLTSPGPLLALAALTLTGFAYGAIIAVYPAAISYLFGPVPGIRAYGRVFTAWGFFGLLLPWLAGYLFDRTGGYDGVLVIAAVISLVSAAAAWRLPEASTSPA
ncbi:MAG: MFS transporter, partial [Pseudomonadota bacterium]